MNLYQFFMAWLTLGMLLVATRKEMIYKEPNKSYRFTLLIICAVFGLVVNVGSGLYAGVVNFVRFWQDTVKGDEP